MFLKNKFKKQHNDRDNAKEALLPYFYCSPLKREHIGKQKGE